MGAKWGGHVLWALWSPNGQNTTTHTRKMPFLGKLGSAEPSQPEIPNMNLKIPVAQDQWCHLYDAQAEGKLVAPLGQDVPRTTPN